MGAGENTGTDGRLLADHALHAIVLDMITRTQTVWPRCAHATYHKPLSPRPSALPAALRCLALSDGNQADASSLATAICPCCFRVLLTPMLTKGRKLTKARWMRVCRRHQPWLRAGRAGRPRLPGDLHLVRRRGAGVGAVRLRGGRAGELPAVLCAARRPRPLPG